MSGDDMTLVEFLRARLDEDEAAALEAVGYESRVYWEDAARQMHLRAASLAHYMRHDPDRVLAEVEAKRAIIDSYADNADPGTMAHSSLTLEWVCAQLALPYADHPDYRQEWKP